MSNYIKYLKYKKKYSDLSNFYELLNNTNNEIIKLLNDEREHHIHRLILFKKGNLNLYIRRVYLYYLHFNGF
jgi:hypothetical protein